MVDILGNIFKPFFGWDILGAYDSAYEFIDFALYLFFFISILRYALKDRFDTKSAKVLSIIIGIAMSIGMSMFSRVYGFRISDIGPLAGIIFLGTLGYLFFKFLRDMGNNTPGAGAIAFLLIYFSLISIVPSFYKWIIDKADFLEAILAFAVIVAVFIAVRDMIRLFTSGEPADFPGIKESDSYIADKDDEADKKRQVAETARKVAERKRAEAEAATANAAAAKSDKERKAHTKVADVKSIEAEKLEAELSTSL